MSMHRTPTLTALFSLGLLAFSPVRADPADWQSPGAVVDALYEVISADAGETRDWDRFRELFLDGAQLSMAMDSRIGSGIMAMGIEDLIAQTDSAYAATGFHETGLVMRVEQHGQLASVMSSFEVRLRRSDAEPLMRGLNHFQLLNDGERWWIVSNIGVVEGPQSPLPAEFLPVAKEAK
jgi:hypothetical protein